MAGLLTLALWIAPAGSETPPSPFDVYASAGLAEAGQPSIEIGVEVDSNRAARRFGDGTLSVVADVGGATGFVEHENSMLTFSLSVGDSSRRGTVATLEPMANGLFILPVRLAVSVGSNVVDSDRWLVYLRVTDDVVEVLSHQEYIQILLDRQLVLRNATGAASTAHLEPGDVPGAGTLAPDETSRCGNTTLCLGR